MSFAKEFKRSQQGIAEEIAYYREHTGLGAIQDSIAVLEELRDKWQERDARYEGRGRAITKPFDWSEDQSARTAAKETMNKVIKAAAAAVIDKRVEERADDEPLPAREIAETASPPSQASSALPASDSGSSALTNQND